MVGRRVARLASLSVLMLYLLYYLPSWWLKTPFTFERVTRFAVPGYPLTGSYLIDYLAIIISTAIYSIYTYPWALATIALLPISLYLLQLSGEPVYLLLIPLQIVLTLVITKTDFKQIILGVLIASAPLSIISLAASIWHFTSGSDSSVLKSLIMPQRIFWSSIGFLSVLALYIAGFIAPLEKGFGMERDSCGCSRRLLLAPLSIPPIAVALTHIPTSNPDLYPISVDTYYYTLFLQRADSLGLWEALKIHNPDRPIYLIAIYYLHRLIQDPVVLMDIVHPIIAIELLVLASYYASKRLYGSSEVSCLWIPMIAASGHSAYGFIAGGYQANSIALPIAIMVIARRGDIYSYLLLQLLALIHPWTFAMYSASWVLSSIEARETWEALKRLLISSTALALGEAINRSISGVGVVSPVTGVAVHALGSIYGADPINNIYYGYAFYAWSSIYIPPIAVLALYSALKGLPASLSSTLLVSSLGATMSIGDPGLIHRIYLNTPLEIIAGGALRDLGGLSRYSRHLIFLAVMAYGYTNLVGLTPLRGMPWEAITRVR